jgi:nucleoside-diphosphate-sugar epimerase
VPGPAAWIAALGWEAAARLRGKPSIISRDKVAEARAGEWICDVARARAELGFQARTPLPEALARTLAWYRQAGLL